MKIFVWNDPIGIRYGGSILFVCANTEEEARSKARSARKAEFSVHESDGEISIDDLGPADAVFDTPYAICYEWSE